MIECRHCGQLQMGDPCPSCELKKVKKERDEARAQLAACREALNAAVNVLRLRREEMRKHGDLPYHTEAVIRQCEIAGGMCTLAATDGGK